MRSSSFFFILLALLFCLSIWPTITSAGNEDDKARYISYDVLRYNTQYPVAKGPIYGHRRLLHSPSSSTASLLIQNACQNNGLDYLGKLCYSVLQRAPVEVECEAKNLAIFALRETGKLVANASVEVKQGLAAHGNDMSVTLRLTFEGCADTWYAQAQEKINCAVTRLTTSDSGSSKVDLVNTIRVASSGVRTCYFNLAGQKFLKGESRVFVYKVNGHNQFLKRMLAAADYLVNATNL